ncbi:MAG: PAS domain S-box protein [Calditrichaeota bacterium]|nr:MAG: PAS domain S-box protein [Calditrichota bacterium]MBL1204491.1 PAS domain S-box protein [Calditrichota bacterium]NOG44320.1 PAS domain S-box protein [Calditrichota bacterium]
MLYKQKILLIHKNKILKKKIAEYLREIDFAVMIAENIEDAFSLAKSIEPDIILWGAALTADAKKILRKIKRSKFCRNAPVIAMIGDIELYDRIELEKNGISDVINADPVLTDLRLKIRLHLEYRKKQEKYEKEISRLQNISEIQYNISIVNDLNRLCELFDDFLYNDYPFDFILQLIYNPKSGDYDYNNFITKDPENNENASDIFEGPVWKEVYFSKKYEGPERISNKKVLDFLATIGLNSEVYYQMPLHANKKPVGVIIAGSTIKQALSNAEFNDLSVLVNSAGQRIFELRKIYGERNVAPQGEPTEKRDIFHRFNDDEIFEYLTKQVLEKLKTDVSIYFNYNKGFRFLYPQYCYQAGSEINLFDDDKPPVLMAKDYPTFEKFLESKKKNAVFNLTKNALPDLAAMTELAGGTYNSILIFTVEIANEVKGYLITANENSMKRFSSVIIKEAETIIRKATDVLMEGRLVKQANQTIKQLDRVFELGKDLTLESHISELLPKIATAIRRTLGWNIVMLDRKNVYENKFENVCYFGVKEKVFKSIQDKYPNTMYSKLKSRCFHQSNSYFLDHKFAQIEIKETDIAVFERKVGKQWNDRDWLFIPILSRGKELGVISVNDPVDRIRPNDDRVRSLEYFANQAAVALENASLFESLKTSETKYRDLAETMTMGLITCDIKGDIIYNNPSFASLMRYENSSSLVGRNIYELASDKASTELEKYVVYESNDDKDDESAYEFGLEVEMLANDNKFVPFKIFLTKSHEHGEKGGFLGVFSDLRPQKRIERLKADFNSMVVHDLRSPLNIIQGYIDIVRNKVVGDISDEQEELLSIAKENCYKVLKLIDNFLIASKLEVGQFQVTPEVNALNTLIESVFENHKILAEKKNIQLELKIDRQVPLISFDKMRVEQVLTNYISNALKFTTHGGKIEIGNRMVSVEKELTGEKQKEIRVWVKDSGVGIDLEEQDKVFNKYEQTEAGKDASLKGTGLGLAICKEIITLHRGKVWVESVPQEGSTFYFTLPVFTPN